MRLWPWKRSEPLPDNGVDWVVRYRARRLRRHERHALREWLAASRDHARDLLRAEAIWRMSGSLAQDQRVQEELMQAQLRRPSAAESNARLLLRIWIAAATAASLAVVAGWLWYGYFGARDWYETAPGDQQLVTLSEGSTIAINTDTRLAVAFDDEQRLIVLERGEALFQVAHDRSRPFIVRAANGDVRAVGTRFNVLVEDRAVTVAVFDGRVEITPKGEKHAPPKLLGAGQSAAYERTGRLVEARPERASQERIVAWRQGKLSFDAWPLDRAVAEHNRYALKPIRLSGPDLGRFEISGVFRIGDTSALLDALGKLPIVNGLGEPIALEVVDEGDALVLTESIAGAGSAESGHGVLPAPEVEADPTPPP